MRILPFLPPHEGYEPSSVELNEEEGVLDISDESDCILLEETKIVAETLILRCALRPIPMAHKTTQVQLISEGELLKPTPLYGKESISYGYEREVENSQWRGVALEYVNIGRGIHQGETFTFHGKNLPMGKIECGNPLYIKPFRIESQNHQVRQTTLPSGQILTSPPGILDARVLRGYGGYYKEGIAIEEIQQVYYSLTSTHSHTRVRLYSSSTLRENQTPPPLGGKDIIFNTHPIEEESLTLPGALAAGYAHFFVTTDCGQNQFRSFLVEPVPGHTTLMNVYFKP